MRVVVFGATGNVGTSLVQRLSSDAGNEAIVGVARRMPEWLPARTTWRSADVATDDLDDIVAGADAVVHLAWLFQPTHDPMETWRSNVIGSERVFDAVGRAGVPVLVYASSVGAYAPGEKVPVDESWPTHGVPHASYCREKAYVERLLDVAEASQPGTRVVRFRPGFIFKRESAPQQRRLFAGPLVPERLAGRIGVPVVPDVPGLVFQAMHTEDAAEAFVQALTTDVRGAFNIAADPVVDVSVLADVFGARTVPLPARLARVGVAAAWRMHLVPASPFLFDYVLRMPLLDTTRARTELGWRPARTAVEALAEFREGLRSGEGFPTPPLAPSAGSRWREVRSGVGQNP